MNATTFAIKWLIFLANVLTLTLVFSLSFYLVPASWILDYKSINVEFSCVEGVQHIDLTSERVPKLTLIGNGEDSIFLSPKDGEAPVRKYFWGPVVYNKGTVNDFWTIDIARPLPPGEYIVQGEPVVSFLFLSRPITPIESNVFTIESCPQNEVALSIEDAVSQAFEKYLEIEGYVVE